MVFALPHIVDEFYGVATVYFLVNRFHSEYIPFVSSIRASPCNVIYLARQAWWIEPGKFQTKMPNVVTALAWMAIPDPPTIRPLTVIYRSHGDYEDLLEWGSFRYHSLLQFNNGNPQAEESVALKNLWAAMATDDENAIEDAAQRCFDILFPFIQADYAWRSQSNDVYPNDPVKLQVTTRDGVLQAVQHNRHIKYPINDPIDNVFSDFPLFAASTIEMVKKSCGMYQKSKLKIRFIVWRTFIAGAANWLWNANGLFCRIVLIRISFVSSVLSSLWVWRTKLKG